MYDIANVLTSLDLIKKVHVREERGRKPAFKWIGPTHFQTSDGETTAPLLAQTTSWVFGRDGYRSVVRAIELQTKMSRVQIPLHYITMQFIV